MSFSFVEFAMLLVLLALPTAVMPPAWAVAWVTLLVMTGVAMGGKIASEIRAERIEGAEQNRQRQAEEAAEQLRRAPGVLAEKIKDGDLKTALLAFQSLAECWEAEMKDTSRLDVLRGRHSVEVLRGICAEMIDDPMQGDGEVRLLHSVRTLSRKMEMQLDQHQLGRLGALEVACSALERQCA